MEWYWILLIVIGSVLLYGFLIFISWCLLKSSSDLYKQEERLLAEIKLQNLNRIIKGGKTKKEDGES